MNVIYDLIIDNYGENIICFKEIRRSFDRYSLCFISLFEYSLGNLWIVKFFCTHFMVLELFMLT